MSSEVRRTRVYPLSLEPPCICSRHRLSPLEDALTMFRLRWVILALVVCLPLRAQDGVKKRTIGAIERLDPAFDALLARDAVLEKLADGFAWTEGPVWVKKGGFLLFS